MAPPTPDPEAEYWTMRDIAAHWDVDYQKVRSKRANGELPPPDLMRGRSPLWRPATITNDTTSAGHVRDRPRAEPDPDGEYWTMRDVAAYWNVSYDTVRVMRSRPRGEVPPEDVNLEGKPLWLPATITNFQRPGRGWRTDLHGRPPQADSEGDAST